MVVVAMKLGLPFTFKGYAYVLDGSDVNRLTLHPSTGKLVRECDVRWPEDYSPREVAQNLRNWYGKSARKRAAALGAWEAEMILAEVAR
jgi:hypothetical protein